ncbi:metallophosphoesterase family protein [Actinokineospora guangxiensis]|uniref:Metallophosphoesterase family protein n=1 Tax=Actinokineospora guangxiensis TaxID=1490288 RepID=A0ABW0ESE4_9PSEU
MRIAVLSDVHGVLPALQAVLAEPDVLAADLVVLTGDVVAGPQPARVLDRLAGLGERAAWLSGNADREVVELRRGLRADIPDPIARWSAGELRPEQVDFLAGLPATVRVGDVLFCHGTPRADDEVVLVDSPLRRWAEAFAGLDESVRTVVCGNTHMPFLRLAHGRLVVNPGSVGMPYGRPGAHWALLDGDNAQLRRTRYDTEAAIAALVSECAYPDIAAWAEYHLRAAATDAQALAAFSRSAGSR